MSDAAEITSSTDCQFVTGEKLNWLAKRLLPLWINNGCCVGDLNKTRSTYRSKQLSWNRREERSRAPTSQTIPHANYVVAVRGKVCGLDQEQGRRYSSLCASIKRRKQRLGTDAMLSGTQHHRRVSLFDLARSLLI